MLHQRDFGSACVCTMFAALIAGASPALAADVGPLLKVTAPSPFTKCTADGVAGQVGVNYPNTGIEPTAAVDPRDPDSLIVGWQQDRWSNGGSRGLMAALSNDERNHGPAYSIVTPGKVTKCEDGPFSRASDPWVDISPSGVVYYMHLAFQPDLPNGGFGPNGMFVTRSFNGGRSWTSPTTLIYDTNPQVLDDKNSITADPRLGALAYAVWDRLQDFTIGAGYGDTLTPLSGGGHDGVAIARQRLAASKSSHKAASAATPAVQFVGPAYFARTTDFGATWSTPKIIFNPGDNAQTINNRVVVTANGAVIDFFTHIFTDGTVAIDLVRSADQGATFGPLIHAQTINSASGAVTPDKQDPIRDASILFDVAVNRRTGAIYLVWEDTGFMPGANPPINQVAFSMSTDDGSTWSKPVRIDRTPNNANPLREQAIIPSVGVGPGGVLAVTYYDFRNDKSNGKEATDYWALFCNPHSSDCTKRANWGGETRLTNASFDMLDAPEAGGHFLGDYMTLKRTGDAVTAVFGIATGKNQTDIFTRKVGFVQRDAAN